MALVTLSMLLSVQVLLKMTVRYKKLTSTYDTPSGAEKYIDLQFKKPPTRIPWKAIGVATTLFIIGSTLITVGALLLSGHIDAKYR